MSNLSSDQVVDEFVFVNGRVFQDVDVARKRENDLLEANNRYLERFRTAERQLREIRSELMLAPTAAIEADLAIRYVQIPKNISEAVAMEAVGFDWLKRNAPSRLTQEGINRDHPDIIKAAVLGIISSHCGPLNTLDGLGGTTRDWYRALVAIVEVMSAIGSIPAESAPRNISKEMDAQEEKSQPPKPKVRVIGLLKVIFGKRNGRN